MVEKAGKTGPTTIFDSDGTTTETTITGLKSNTAYLAQVRAVNADGPGRLVTGNTMGHD